MLPNRLIKGFWTSLLIVFLSVSSALAQVTLEPEMEERARSLFLELRCVVCQNQSIGDSDADVAKDLREIVREQMVAGKTDGEIRSFLVARYGEFILLKPVFAIHTLVLWVAPFVLLTLGLFFAWWASRNRKSLAKDVPLTEDEQAELDKLIRQ